MSSSTRYPYVVYTSVCAQHTLCCVYVRMTRHYPYVVYTCICVEHNVCYVYARITSVWSRKMKLSSDMTRVLQCVAVCCSVWQCVAVCGSVWQCVAVCCSVLQCDSRKIKQSGDTTHWYFDMHHMCDTTRHSCAWHDSFICTQKVTQTYTLMLCVCVYDICVKSHNKLVKWHDWLIFQSDQSDWYFNMTHMSNTTHMSLVRMCDITHSCVWHINEYVWYHAFMCVAHIWYYSYESYRTYESCKHVCDVIHSCVWYVHENMWYHSFMCVTHKWYCSYD